MKAETKVQQSCFVTSLGKPNAYFETLYEAARYARDVNGSTVYRPTRYRPRILAYGGNGVLHVTMGATVNEAATIREVPVLIEMTLNQARMLGLVVCAHCGMPPNNHWGDGEPGGKCAHDSKCPGYEQKIRLPMED